MWYEKIVGILLSKITIKEHYVARCFCNKFFERINKTVFQENNAPHFIYTLGLIEKLFLKFENRKDYSVSLEEFARYLIGLAVVYAKIDSNNSMKNIDFLPLLKEPFIIEALNPGQDILGLLVIQRLEGQVLADLNGQFKINFQILQAIFSDINFWYSMSDFFAEAAPLIDGDSDFSDFVKEIYQFTAEIQRELITKSYEEHFIQGLAELAQLTADYQEHPIISEFYPKLCALHMQLVLAGFAYLLKPNCRSFCQFKTTALNKIGTLMRELPYEPAMDKLLNRIIFAVFSVGQYQLTMVVDSIQLTEEEQNFLFELNKFYSSCDHDCKLSAGLFRHLTVVWAKYIVSKDIINYFMFKKIALILFDKLDEQLGLVACDRLRFALLGLDLGCRSTLKKSGIEEEEKFYLNHLLLAKKVAETRLEFQWGRSDILQADLEYFEDLSLGLDNSLGCYFSSQRENSDLELLLMEIDIVLSGAKKNLGEQWFSEIIILERLGENLKMSCTKSSKPLYTKEEDVFIQQVHGFTLECSSYTGTDVAIYAADAGRIEALALRLSTTTTTYFDFKTLANFRVCKQILIETIEHDLPRLKGVFFSKLVAVKLALESLNPPETVYKNCQHQLIFPLEKTQANDDVEPSPEVESAQI